MAKIYKLSCEVLVRTSFLLFFLVPLRILIAGEELTPDPVWNLTATYDQISPSKWRSKNAHRAHTVAFKETNLIATCIKNFNEHNSLEYGIGYVNTHLNHKQRWHFEQETFNNLLISLGEHNKSLDYWRFDTNVYMQANTQHLSSPRYLFFRWLFHSIYEWRKDLRFNIGVEGTTGMHYTYTWPALGFEWEPSEQWRLNFVYPSNISALYNISQHFSVIGSMHYFISRQRLGEDEEQKLKRGLIAYRNTGLELGLNYNLGQKLLINFHIGHALGARVHVSDRHDQHHHYHKFRSAPYFGGIINYLF
jgi:hypothetical protein